MGHGHILDEYKAENPQQGVNADFGQQSGEDGGDRRRRGVVGRWQPEKKRKRAGLETECHDKEHGHRRHQAGIREGLHLSVQVGHIEGAGQRVQQPQAGDEHQGGHQIEGDVFNASV